MAKPSRTRRALKAKHAKRDAAANRQASADREAPLSPPFGYREEDGQRVADEAEGETIGIIRELGEKHLSAQKIAEKLTRDEVDCRGEAWTAGRVTQILRRRVTKIKGR